MATCYTDLSFPFRQPMPVKKSDITEKPSLEPEKELPSSLDTPELPGAPEEPAPAAAATPTESLQKASGVLELMADGYGFLRANGITPGPGDIYISQSQIKRFDLRPGDQVEGEVRPPKEAERYLGMLRVTKINGVEPEKASNRPRFEKLVAVYPNRRLKLETGKTPLSTRLIDIVTPIGFGQRGLIVSPPKAGKTTILKEIAHGVTANHPKAQLMAVLIGERPEEVTDIARTVRGEVYASNFDESYEAQTKIAEMALERAKRMVETGHDVVILLDSITRLARAYNGVVTPSGRTLTGGFDPSALYPTKRFFGAARNFETTGSLTIIGTALVDTGSRLDDLVYEEFKGTGNMELHLDRRLSERRIFPSIDITSSSTRNEELLLSEDELKAVYKLRRMLDTIPEGERTELVVDRLAKTESNKDFLSTLHASV